MQDMIAKNSFLGETEPPQGSADRADIFGEASMDFDEKEDQAGNQTSGKSSADCKLKDRSRQEIRANNPKPDILASNNVESSPRK